MPRRLPLSLLMIVTLGWLAACTTPSAEPTATVPVPTLAPTLRPPPPTPVFGAFDPASVAHINLADYPIIPEISPTARQLYVDGLAGGSNPRVFSKLGDCMTENPYFLLTFAEGRYDLGPYAELGVDRNAALESNRFVNERVRLLIFQAGKGLQQGFFR